MKPNTRAPIWPYLLAIAVALITVVTTSSLMLALSSAVVTAVSAMCFATVPVSRRKVTDAEDTARFISVLANQATVSRTVNEAITRAAPLMDGAVGESARTLAQECRTNGIEIAAQHFAQRTNTAAAAWLAEVIISAAAGGGKWASVLDVLESEATQDAVTARHFHSQVASSLTQTAAAILLGAGIVVGSARINPSTWEWFLNSDGPAVSFAMTLGVALFGWKLLSGAWEVL